jgi:uncharacterized protein (TIGR01777 family)
MRALITGATGTIGQRLVTELGGDALVLSRDPDRAARDLGTRATSRTRVKAWSGREPVDLEGVEAVFHLAGEPVAEGRWSDEKKRRIRDSRVDGTRAIVQSIAQAERKPRVLVCASAVGYYGSRGDELLTEASAPGEGFLPDVCRAWEDEARGAEAHGVRVVSVRIGVVLAREGGALPRMLPVFRAGLAGKLGSGTQWMPWIHVEDVIGLFLHAATNATVEGPMNAAAPELVTNRTFTKALARALHRPAIFAAPRALLGLALGETASVVLASQRVVPERALETGYRFRYPSLARALDDLVGPRKASAPAEVRP